jgi:carboxymethylenebutenolidase
MLPLMTKRVTYVASNGQTQAAATASLHPDQRLPGVVMIHEWWGLNDHISSLVDKLAQHGFFVVAPDLYHGKTTKDPTEASHLMRALDWPRALSDIEAAVKFAKASPSCNGKVGVMGFCMGGALTFAAGCKIPKIDALVPFYGIPGEPYANYQHLRAPVLAHFATRDEWATVSAATRIAETLRAHGTPMQLCTYEADHAFVNSTRPEVYNEAQAELAWSRTIEFFKQHLS